MTSPFSVSLFNVRAESLDLSNEEWAYALELACSHGWKPEGARKPPISIDGIGNTSWDGSYLPACGQEMSFPDARALSECLKNAVAGKRMERFQALAHYAERGGFIICPAITSQVPVATSLAQNTARKQLHVPHELQEARS